MSPVAVRAERGSDRRRVAVMASTFILLMAAWHGYATMVYDRPIPLPTPVSTVEAFVEMIQTGELQEAAFESLQVLLLGAIPGIVIGIALGLLIGAVRPLDTSLAPYVYAFYATPFPALIPIFVLVFGLGNIGKAMIVFTLVVTTVLLQTIAGVRDVDARFIEAARSLRASRWRMLLEVQFPASLAFTIAGIRLAIGRALVGVVVAEFDTALSGLGALIFRHSGRLRLSHALVPAIVFSITGILIYILLHRAERHFARWKEAG